MIRYILAVLILSGTASASTSVLCGYGQNGSFRVSFDEVEQSIEVNGSGPIRSDGASVVRITDESVAAFLKLSDGSGLKLFFFRSKGGGLDGLSTGYSEYSLYDGRGRLIAGSFTGMCFGKSSTPADEPAPSSTDERTPNASCKFVVDGKTYINGPCLVSDDEYSEGPDFSFDDLKMKVECPKGRTDCYGYEMVTVQTGTIGMLTTDGSQTTGGIYWNGGESQRMDDRIEPMILQDGCWVASNAELCVQKN